jgi:hypothetical protein
VQVAVVSRQEFPHAVFERGPGVFNGIEIRRVRRQEFLRTACPCNELPGVEGLVEAGVIVHHDLSRFKYRHQTLLNIRLEECGVAGSLENQRGNKLLLGERGDQTHALGTMPGFLAPTWFSLRTPAIRAGFVIIHPGLIRIYALLSGNRLYLLAKLLPQRFVPLSIAEGLFLWV